VSETAPVWFAFPPDARDLCFKSERLFGRKVDKWQNALSGTLAMMALIAAVFLTVWPGQGRTAMDSKRWNRPQPNG
jgi:hypothetical protein